MLTRTQKIYLLISAIALILLSALLLVGTILPVFTVNMGTVETAEMFEKGHFTEGLEIDEAKIGLGNVLKLVKNRKYVSIINSVQKKEQEIRDTYELIAKSEDASNEWRGTQLSHIAELQEEISTTLNTLTDADYEKMKKLFLDKGFVNALYAEIGVVSLFTDTVASRSGENDIYKANILDVFTTIFGMIFLVGFMISAVIFALISLVTALKRIFALATGFKHLDFQKIQAFYAGRAISALLPILFFYTLAKAALGSKLVMGVGLWISLIAATVIGLIPVITRIIFTESRNPKHIARTLLALLSFVFALCIFHNVTNMDLAESYYQSNAANVEEAYQEKYEEAYLSSSASSFSSRQYYAKEAATAHVTEILTKNAVLLLAGILLTSILAFNLLSRTYNRLREKNGDFRGEYSAARFGSHYVLAFFLALAVLFTATLGVSTVEERDEAYLDGGVEILFDSYTVADSGIKEEYDALVEARAELIEKIEEAEGEIKEIEDEDEKAEYTFELSMAKRRANKMALRIEALKKDDTARRMRIIILLAVLIVLEVMYKGAPKFVDKFLPDSIKRLLAGNGGTPKPTTPAPAPAPKKASGGGKAKQAPTPTPTPTPATSNDDLADEMQRMFDNR